MAVEDSIGGYRLDTLEKKEVYFFDRAGNVNEIVAYDIKTDSVIHTSETTFEDNKEQKVKMVFYTYDDGAANVNFMDRY